MTISGSQSAEHAMSYYANENYYMKDSYIGVYHGGQKMMDFLGIKQGEKITPKIGKKIYKNLLLGVNPKNGEKLLRNSQNETRSAGFDVTFSAPKSVSMLYEFASKKYKRKIKEAHEKAVLLTMKKLERYALARVGKNKDGSRKIEKGSIVYAQFTHDSGRENKEGYIDPTLHTHNFIMNLALDGNGKTFSLLNGKIFNQKMYLGRIYRQTLAKEIEKNTGLKMEVIDEKQGFYEIAGIGRELIEKFSGRSIELEEAVKSEIESGKTSIKNKYQAKNRINSKTKKAKKGKSRDEITEINHRRLEAYTGLKVNEWLKEIAKKNNMYKKEKNLKRNENISKKIEEKGITHEAAIKEIKLERVRELIDIAIRSLEAETSLFAAEEIAKRVMTLGSDDFISEEEISIEINRLLVKEKMLKGWKLENEEIVLSTKAMYDAEIMAISAWKRGINKVDSLENLNNSNAIWKLYKDKYSTMNKGQTEMVKFVLHSKDRIIGIQGDAGTGKTFSFKFLKEALDSMGIGENIIGLSFSGQAAAGLEKDSGIKSSTIHKFLAKESSAKDKRVPSILVVDEATMVGSLQMEQLIHAAEKNGDRLILLGDPKQFSSISAGSIYSDMLNSGMPKAELTEIVRQKDKGLKKIINHIKNKRYTMAVEGLNKRGAMLQLDIDESILKASSIYLESIKNTEKYGDKILDAALVIASTNIVRNNINKSIRKSLIHAGVVEDKGQNYKTLATVSLHGVSKFSTKLLEEQQPQIMKGGYAMTGIKSGELYTIEGYNHSKKCMHIKKKDGEIIEIDIEKHGDKVQFFKEESREFRCGDIITLTHNQKLRNGAELKNGQRGKILSVDASSVTIDLEGKAVVVDLNEYPYVDYGYCVTDFKSQGATTGHVIAVASTKMATQNSFYTQITRAKYDATIITEDSKKFLENAKRSGIEKSTLGMKRINEISVKANEKIDFFDSVKNNFGASPKNKIARKIESVLSSEIENNEYYEGKITKIIV